VEYPSVSAGGSLIAHEERGKEKHLREKDKREKCDEVESCKARSGASGDEFFAWRGKRCVTTKRGET